MFACKCGCGEMVKGRRVFVNKAHHIQWMLAGGAREMNAQLPDEVRRRGGSTAGHRAHASGRLRVAAKKGSSRNLGI